MYGAPGDRIVGLGMGVGVFASDGNVIGTTLQSVVKVGTTWTKRDVKDPGMCNNQM